MRSIGHLADQKAAVRFSDFLFLQGIENEVEPDDDGGFAVWVFDEDQVKPAGLHLARFRENPDAAEFVSASTAAEKQRQVLEKAQRSKRSTVADMARIGYEGAFRATPYFTYFLIVASIAVAIYTQLGMDRRAIQPLAISQYFTTGLAEIRGGQVWRLFTPIFLHFSIMHLVFNMMLLKDLGTFVETRFGSTYLAVFVLLAAVISNLGQFFWDGPAFGGMSGVDYALFGFLWIRGKYDRRSSWQLSKNTVYIMVGWFLLCLTGILGPIANAAHGVGLVAGMAWGFVSSRRPFSG